MYSARSPSTDHDAKCLLPGREALVDASVDKVANGALEVGMDALGAFRFSDASAAPENTGTILRMPVRELGRRGLKVGAPAPLDQKRAWIQFDDEGACRG